jgi:effector-binding domain-containing protein
MSTEPRTEHRDPQPTAVVRATVTITDVGAWIGQAFDAAAGACAAQGVEMAGMPFGRFHAEGGGRFEAEAGFPVVSPIEAAGEVVPSQLPGGPVVVTVHVGPYDQVEPAYLAAATWVAEQGGTLDGDAWEVYLSDPDAEPDPATWRTEVVQPYQPAS